MEVVKVPGKKRGATYYTCAADRGFFYRNNKTSNGKFYLVCTERGCSARACCDQLQFIKIGEGHNHLPDMEKERALLLRNSMINAAASSSEDIKSIFVRQTASSAINVASKLAFPSTSRAMRRERIRVQPPMPQSLEEYGTLCEESDRYGKVADKPFCRGVTGEGEMLSVIFVSEGLKHLVAQAKEIHLDGTFKIRPRHPENSQLLTIMVIQYGYAFPCVFALMKSRKTAAYDNVFKKVQDIVPQFNPQLIMTDFEMPLVNSLIKNFPEARKTGCFFHYCQAVLRKARTLNMTHLLRHNNDAKRALKLLMAVALLPPNSIKAGVDYITSFLRDKNLSEDFSLLLRYHRSQWLDKVGVDALSVFKRARRTNNDSESFHATLVRLIRVRGPNVWEFTERLQDISASTASELQSFTDEGLQIRELPRRKYKINDAKIKKASQDFEENGDIGRFLNSVHYSVERLFQNAISEEQGEEYNSNDEEFVLVPLLGDVPVEFRIGNTETNEEEATEEETSTTNEVEEIREQVEEQTAGVCMICQTAPPTTVLLPCKHFGLCDECSTTQQRLDQTPASPEDIAYDTAIDHSICPIDRLRVEQYVRVVVT